jgi:hypothetical protein
MQLNGKPLQDYLYCLCLSPYDKEGQNLCAEKLKKLSKVLPTEQYQQICELDDTVNNLTQLLSQEDKSEGSQQNTKLLQKCEQVFDDIQIPNKYKVVLYENLLTGIEEYERNDLWYRNVLEKKLHHIAGGADNELNYVAFKLMQHNGGLPKYEEKLFMAKIYKKMKNKNAFLYKNYYGKDCDKEFKAILGHEEHKKNLAAYNILMKQSQSRDLSDSQKEKILLDALELCGHCGFSRQKNFYNKAQICNSLQNIYAGTMQTEKAEEYLEKTRYWQKQEQKVIYFANKKRNRGNGR